MTKPIDNSIVSPNELTLFTVQTSEGVKDYCPATVRVEFRGVEENSEKVLLTKILEALPVLLTAADDSDIEERVNHLCRALRLEDWRANAKSEMLLNGNAQIEWFFKNMPLLTDEELGQRISPSAGVAPSKLMQIRYDGKTYYFADQFEPDGSINTDCLLCWRTIASNPSSREWENALWWMARSGWLDGRAPRDLFRENPALVFDAAEQEALRSEE